MAVGHWNDSVIDLIPAYRATRKALNQLRTQAQEKADKELLGGMLSDVEYTLEWLETGRRPGQIRGVERRYERSWDPAWINEYRSASGRYTISSGRELTDDEQQRIDDAMCMLTDREKECFIMHMVFGMTFAQIAVELHVGRSTVQTHIERARSKIEEAKQTSLFLL